MLAVPSLANHSRPGPLATLGLLLILCCSLAANPACARNVSQATGNLLLDASHGNGEAWGKPNCSSCHALQRLHNSVPDIKTIVNRKKFRTCTGCHGSNGSNAGRQCIVCHNSKDLPLSPVRGGRHRHDFNTPKDLRTTSKQCVVCHQSSDMDGQFELNRDLTVFNDADVGKKPYNNKSEFCLRCHNVDHQQKKWRIKHAGNRDQSLRAEDYYTLIDAHGVRDGDGIGLYNGLRSGAYAYQTIVDCSDCHSLHGTRNPNLIIENSRQGVPLLEQDIRNHPYPVDIVGDDYSDLCVLCHNMSQTLDGGDTVTRNGLTGVHFNSGSDCAVCHNHGESVQRGL
ncbi:MULTISPECIES: multiheme c-type cytochrome [Methylomonas]|uniref:multiheme c-type cytochrome n=1 Tax=Methylomonas TaxID=416 RepID=UPI0012323CE1|nr:cytochrome c3 family protein [Methylomonas rhizoryzae]